MRKPIFLKKPDSFYMPLSTAAMVKKKPGVVPHGGIEPTPGKTVS
jgi:hypothetical protein